MSILVLRLWPNGLPALDSESEVKKDERHHNTCRRLHLCYVWPKRSEITMSETLHLSCMNARLLKAQSPLPPQNDEVDDQRVKKDGDAG